LHTYFLSRSEVGQYVRDFVSRLESLGDKAPLVWCPIGRSGEEIAAILADAVSAEQKDSIQVVPLSFERDTNTILLSNMEDKKVFSSNPAVLVMDSSVHSGSAMRAAAAEVITLGASAVMTYSLVIKKSTSFIPNYFGLVIDDCDRAFFLLDAIPNNRLMPFGCVRRLEQKDVNRCRQCLDSGVASIDSVTWADLWYDAKTRSSHVFVYEQDKEIEGFISFSLSGRKLFIDAIAVDKRGQGKHIGSNLMRWAETFARASNCGAITLWAINERKNFYKHMGYDVTSEEMDLGHEKYTRMSRKLLYNLTNNHAD